MRRISIAILGVALVAAGRASAEAFGAVTYDAKTDELVVTMLYSGTNSDHVFSLKWDECTKHPDGTNDVTAEVIDSQERDAASQDFKKTVHLSLEGLTCRPATVTLRAAPRTYISVRVPALPPLRTSRLQPDDQSSSLRTASRDSVDLAAWGRSKSTTTKKVMHIRQRVRKV